jgi:hypothetical protein
VQESPKAVDDCIKVVAMAAAPSLEVVPIKIFNETRVSWARAVAMIEAQTQYGGLTFSRVVSSRCSSGAISFTHNGYP